MKHMEAIDVRHTYYMVKFLHECTIPKFRRMANTTPRKIKHNQKQSESDLNSYIDEVIENLDNLPKEWQKTYEAHKEADNKTLAQRFIENCKPY